MILQALNDYYDRLREAPDSGVPEFGFGLQGVHFCLTIDGKGNVVGDPLDLRDEKGKPKRIEVPGPVGRTAGVSSNFAWDNTGYVLGADDKGKPERVAETHAAFVAFSRRLLGEVSDKGGDALLAFLEKWEPAWAESFPNWEDMAGLNVVFRLEGERKFLHERPEFRRAWNTYIANSEADYTGMCLISGDKEPISATHAKIKGVLGAQSSGAALVSFNFDAAVSYGKKQNLNAPVSERAAFAYTTALNHLLAPGSERKVQVGDTTVVFWTDSPSGDVVPMFGFALGGKPSEDIGLSQRLEGHIKAIARGRMPEELGDPKARFYVLGLSPNAARISVRFWHVGTVGDMAENLGAHYQALALKPNFDSEPEHPGPWWLLKELAPQRDSRNMSPLLSGQLLKAILKNQPYPRTLLTAALGRIRADKTVNYLRAAIIKASLVRNEEEEIHMTLDKENADIGYRLGRLFAILERTQHAAMGKINATVTDKYFSSAAATPELVFPILIKTAKKWLSKIRRDKDKEGLAYYFDNAIMEIVDALESSTGYPKTLSLKEQGLFTIGYYQQKAFKKEDKTEE